MNEPYNLPVERIYVYSVNHTGVCMNSAYIAFRIFLGENVRLK